MSGVAIIVKLLEGHNAMAGIVPQTSLLPVIGVMEISDRKWQTLSDDDKDIVIERVQATVMTKSYSEQKSLIRSVKAACKSIEQVFTFSYGSYICKSIIQEFVGPDFYDSESLVYMQSVDFMVKYQRSN